MELNERHLFDVEICRIPPGKRELNGVASIQNTEFSRLRQRDSVSLLIRILEHNFRKLAGRANPVCVLCRRDLNNRSNTTPPCPINTHFGQQ
jgi:hypothetical protein